MKEAYNIVIGLIDIRLGELRQRLLMGENNPLIPRINVQIESLEVVRTHLEQLRDGARIEI